MSSGASEATLAAMGVGPQRGGGAREQMRPSCASPLSCCVALSQRRWRRTPPPLTPKTLEAALAAKPQGPEADRLAERIRTYFGGRGAAQGIGGAEDRRSDRRLGGRAAAASPPTRRRRASSSDAVHFTMPLTRVGTSGLYAGVAHSVARRRRSPGTTRRPTAGSAAASSRSTRRTPTAARQPGVPKGTLKQMPPWESKIFAGTKRDWWVYVPAQYRPRIPPR